MTPPLLAPGRRRAFAALAALSAAEAGLLAASAAAAQTTVAALAADRHADGPLAWLCVAAAGAAAAVWGRAAAAEAFGMAYANEVREQLAGHALSDAARGRKPRIGTVTARMAGDLPALKHWVSLGLSDGAAALAAAVAGVIALVSAAQTIGAVAAIAMFLVLGIWLSVSAHALRQAWAAVRIERGRVSALVGDIVLASRAISAFGAQERELKRLRRRAAKLRAASVAQRGQAALVLAPSAVMLPIALMLAAVGPAFGLAAPSGAAGWAGYLFGAGLLTGAAAGLGRALDAWLAFAVASDRIERLAEAEPAQRAKATPVAPPATPSRPRVAIMADANLQLEICGATRTVSRGEALLLNCAEASEAASCLLLPGSQARVGTTVLSELPLEARAGLVAVASPDIPLLRASLWRNLSPRRRGASKDRLERALRLAGIAPEAWPIGRIVEPESSAGLDPVRARLRIARAIACRPAAIIIAEPALLQDPDLPLLARRIAAEIGVAVICGSAARDVSAAA